MEYRTNDFVSPSGHMMIYGVYDEEANSFLHTLAIKESYNKGKVSYEDLMFVGDEKR